MRTDIRSLAEWPWRLPSGPGNAITDVPGVRVGHRTIRDAARGICTGITVIEPPGDLLAEPLPAAVHVINGYGKSTGLVQVAELGQIETPIALTGVFAVGAVLDAFVRRLLTGRSEIGSESAGRSVNAVVMECNDSYLHDPRALLPGADDLEAAFDAARGGAVPLGAVGAGTGMRTFGFAGAVGSASRVVGGRRSGHVSGTGAASVRSGAVAHNGTAPAPNGGGGVLNGGGGALNGAAVRVGTAAVGADRASGAGHVAALVLSNYGRPRDLLFAGRPARPIDPPSVARRESGSAIVVLATDLPLDSAHLVRMARRAQSGLARTGCPTADGSGEIVLAFSTFRGAAPRPAADLLDDVFVAVAECVEESVWSGLLAAGDSAGRAGRVNRALTVADLAPSPAAVGGERR